MDPTLVRAGTPADPGPVLAWRQEPSGPLSLWHHSREFTIASKPPAKGAIRILAGKTEAAEASAGVGLDDSGHLIYVVVSKSPNPSADAQLLKRLLKPPGVPQTPAAGKGRAACFGGATET